MPLNATYFFYFTYLLTYLTSIRKTAHLIGCSAGDCGHTEKTLEIEHASLLYVSSLAAVRRTFVTAAATDTAT